ncbi:glycosyltransferase [Salinibacterium sp. PAMC 21357]|uniref:glycosyltransferase n=1 Tax=Salinibacterium sp. PAMC 21357 TaxID=1112215 RepID=UPI0002886F6E|nr:glycosyltransferase [Salinibacterium sp. PAMC 21357]
MRILVHLNSLELGGTQINAVDFAAALRARGIESLLVGDRESQRGGPSLLDIAAAKGVHVEPYEAAPGVFAHAKQLTRFADDFGADLIHVYGSWGGGRPTFWGPARWGTRPWVLTVYEMQVSHKTHRHMPLIVGTGYLLDEQAARPGGVVLISPPVDLVSDAPDAVDGAAFRAQHGLGDGLLLVIVSRLVSSMKSLPIGVAIDAMRTLSDWGVTLAIVGSGDSEAAIALQAAEVNNEVGRDAVRLLGPLADPRPAYASADVMLGMGGSAARSLAFGKPLVVQGEAGFSALFEPGSAAVLARSSYWSPDAVPDPVGMLLDSLAPVLDDPQYRAELGAFGREFATSRFGLEAMTDRLAEVYSQALRRRFVCKWIKDLPREGRRLAEKLGRFVGRSAP